MLLIGKRNNITNQHNIAEADIIRPRNSHDFIGTQLAGCGDPTHLCRVSGTKSSQKFILPTVGANFVRLNFLWFSDNALRIDSPCGCLLSAIAEKFKLKIVCFAEKREPEI